MMESENNYRNFIVRISMSQKEMHGFTQILPLIGISLSPGEANVISRVLGHASVDDLTASGFADNPFLKNAFHILAFLYVSRHDPYTFNDFYKRLVFTDKEVERKVKTIFNVSEDTDNMSTELLELMYILETDKDEWDASKENYG